MGIKAKVSKDFSSNCYSDIELNVKASNIILSMTDNINFPTPVSAMLTTSTKNTLTNRKMGIRPTLP
jgi:hypothetical protein